MKVIERLAINRLLAIGFKESEVKEILKKVSAREVLFELDQLELREIKHGTRYSKDDLLQRLKIKQLKLYD